jgi:hypothetical protein
MPKLLLGSISICLDGDPRNESRIKTHQAQLRWLESMTLGDYEYFRVEQCYTPEFRQAVSTTLLNFTPLVFEKGLGPAAARNQLLKRLYDSDSDWLVCLDDDRDIYSHYGANHFIEELTTNPALLKLAETGVLINGVCPARRPFKKDNTAFGLIETHWNLRKACIDGCLQVCCIPNVVKYGHKPIWFDETNDCMHGKPPEDIQFELDWILAKHQIATNLMMIVRDIVPENYEVSTVYATQALRKAVMDTHPKAINDYIKTATRNRITNLNDFNKRKNGFEFMLVPRTIPYQAVQSDYGKYKTIEPSNS